MEGEINILQLNTSLQNYDKTITLLNEELRKLKHDHDNLKTEFTIVLEENKTLSERLRNFLNSQCDQKKDEVSADEKFIINLKEQIAELLAEKNCIMKLWQNSVKTVENLENKFRIFHAETETFIPKPELDKVRISYEQKLRQMEQTLVCTKQKLNESIKHAIEDRETKGSKIEQSLENQETAFKIIKNLESEILKLQSRLEYTVEQKVCLEKSLKYKENILQGIKHKNTEYWTKLMEAVSVVDAALNEKDAALLREQETKGKNENLLQKIDEIIRNYENKIEKELLFLTSEYEKKQCLLLEDINKAQSETKLQEMELEEYKKKCISLENDIKRIHTSSTDGNVIRLLELERKMESTFQTLINSEKQNIHLAAEKQTMKNDIEQMANLYESNIKAKNTEIESFKIRTKRLEEELEGCYKEIDKMSNKITKLNLEINNMEAELITGKKNLATFNEQHSHKVEELTKNYNRNVNDLQIQIYHKNELIDKWKKESNIIIADLEKVVKHLKNQTHNLKNENRNIKEMYTKSLTKINNYKKFIELISNDVSKLNVSVLEKYSLV